MFRLLSVSGLLALGILSGSPVFAHNEGGSRVAIEREDESNIQAGKFSLTFQLVDVKERSLLGSSDLALLHTKKLHLFIFDPALKEFRHVHPEYTNSKWHVDSDLKVNGDYWVWVQGEIQKGSEEFTTSIRLKVVGGEAANPFPTQMGDVKSGTDRGSLVTISQDKVVAKKMTMLMLRFTRADGSTPSLTSYFGALAHVVSVPQDGDSLVHVHPMSTGQPNTLMLHTSFPEPGEYRLWVQFNDANILRTVPLSVEVVSE
jgi:hypothetical protein